MREELEPTAAPLVAPDADVPSEAMADPRCASLEHARTALHVALSEIESALASNGDWQALRQHASGLSDRPEISELDALSPKLLAALSRDPAFAAMQAVQRALACLRSDPPTVDAAPAATEVSIRARDVDENSAHPSNAVDATSMLAAQNIVRPVLDLAMRIPTLRSHQGRAMGQRLADLMPTASDGPVKPADEADLYAEYRGDIDTTRFTHEAVGIDEAEVKITRQAHAEPMLVPRLPPLPFSEHAVERGGKLPRASRAATVRWADAPDEDPGHEFRPVGSALDEAQVAIIVTTEKTEAQSRAERRALGVAPDREQHMHRFLKTLSGS